MSLDDAAFATKIATEINAVNPNCPLEGTTQLEGFAGGINAEIKSAIVTYSDFPAYSLGGIITGMVSVSLASKIKDLAGYPSVSAQLLSLSNAIVTHLMLGICNAGVIVGYSESVLAPLMATALGVSVTPEITAKATGIVGYLTDNAEASTGSPIVSIS